MNIFKTLGAALAIAFTLGAGHAAAVTYTNEQVVDGNDCSGVLGQPFGSCTLNGSAVIAKLNPNGSVSELGGFATIDGSEFTVTETSQGVGTWTYTPGIGDPSITGWTAKGGNGFTVFIGAEIAGFDGLSGSFFTPNNPSGKPAGLSHITFFNGDPVNPIPLPAAGWMLIAGAGALVAAGRRRKA